MIYHLYMKNNRLTVWISDSKNLYSILVFGLLWKFIYQLLIKLVILSIIPINKKGGIYELLF